MSDLQTALAATLRYRPVLGHRVRGRPTAIVDFTFNPRRRVQARRLPGCGGEPISDYRPN